MKAQKNVSKSVLFGLPLKSLVSTGESA